MKNLTKHFTQITKKKGIRPILQGINYNHTKDQLEATDSHRLLMINASYNLNESLCSIHSHSKESKATTQTLND